MAPHVDRFKDLVPVLFGLLDDVLILYAWILLLKQQLDKENTLSKSLLGLFSFPPFLFVFMKKHFQNVLRRSAFADDVLEAQLAPW